ncbi:hypothetical protein D3C78_1403230 [compost metagenome]
MPAALLFHVCDHRLGGVHHALEVGVQQGFQVFRAVVDKGLGQEEAGVVDQHLDTAEGFDGGGQELARAGRVGHVAGHANEVVRIAQAGGGFLQPLDGAGAADDVVAVVEEGLGQAQADTAGCAGDDDGLLAHDGFLTGMDGGFCQRVGGGLPLVRRTIFVLILRINPSSDTSIDTRCNES